MQQPAAPAPPPIKTSDHLLMVPAMPSPPPLSCQVSAVRESLSRLFLPAGYPVSVTDDYLPYQLATVPAHITGWLSISLVTSSLLKAVGISAGAGGSEGVGWW